MSNKTNRVLRAMRLRQSVPRSKDNEVGLLAALARLAEKKPRLRKAIEVFIRYYGIGCEPKKLTEICVELGFKGKGRASGMRAEVEKELRKDEYWE